MSVDASAASIRIGPIVVRVLGSSQVVQWLLPQHQAFLTSEPADVLLRVSTSDAPLIGPEMPTVEAHGEGFRLAYHGWRAQLQQGVGEARVYAGPDSTQRGPRRLASLLRIVIQTHLAGRSISLHAATLSRHGYAWVCVGARGVGKTTLARRYTSRPRLGDDYALLESSRAGFVVHGTPYAGREGTSSEPGELPLRALILLQQSNRLRVTSLSRSAAFPQLLTHVIAADLSQEGITRRLGALERLVTICPVLRLEFRRYDSIWEPLEAMLGSASWVEAI